MTTTQPAARDLQGRAMPPPLRSISSRMLGILSSSSAALRSEEETNKNTPDVSGTATASEICHRSLHVSAQQEEKHQNRPSSHAGLPGAANFRRQRRASSVISTRSSQGEDRRRSSLISLGSSIISDLTSAADEMMSSLALEAAGDLDPPKTNKMPSSRRVHLSKRCSLPSGMDNANDALKNNAQRTDGVEHRTSRRASYHYPGVIRRTSRRSSCSSLLSTDSEQSEIHHRHQIYFQTTSARRKHSELYDIDDDHEDDMHSDDESTDISQEEVAVIAVHRPGTSLAGNDAQESVRDLNFFEEDQFAVVDGLVTLSSSPINTVASRAG